MRASDDVSNLFARFGGQVDEYQDIVQQNQAAESKARWALLSAVRVERDARIAPPVQIDAGTSAAAQDASAAAPAGAFAPPVEEQAAAPGTPAATDTQRLQRSAMPWRSGPSEPALNAPPATPSAPPAAQQDEAPSAPPARTGWFSRVTRGNKAAPALQAAPETQLTQPTAAAPVAPTEVAAAPASAQPPVAPKSAPPEAPRGAFAALRGASDGAAAVPLHTAPTALPQAGPDPVSRLAGQLKHATHARSEAAPAPANAPRPAVASPPDAAVAPRAGGLLDRLRAPAASVSEAPAEASAAPQATSSRALNQVFARLAAPAASASAAQNSLFKRLSRL